MDCIIQSKNGIGGLFCGAIEAAHNVPLLKYHGITHVLTLSYELSKNIYFILDVQYQPSDYIDHFVLECRDLAGFAISSMFLEAHKFIESSRSRGNVLVHCMAGIL